ncbi:MAG: hypothetical protein JNN05_05770 [Candidatus Omnitrophica bacterium]|nr:hypothetical protein [Candidatus Omnitrophota bacterium]
MNLFFLSYQAWTSQIIIFHDSIGYENLAGMFLRGEWKEYFLTGPSREPAYSLLIACSMSIAQWLHTNHLDVQIMLQVAILTVTQILMYKLLKKLQISDVTCALILLYMGLSPALTSSGLILFSEIITYPIVLWLILALSHAWSQFQTASLQRNIINAFSFVLPALLITFTKAAFELIIPTLLLPFIWKSYLAYKERLQKTVLNSLIFIAAVICTFEGPIIAYKMVNLHCNGIYALTDRGPEALYGNTLRRMAPLSGDRLKSVLAYMTGADVCARLYKDRCEYWGYGESDLIGANKMNEMRSKGIPREVRNKICIRESIQTILRNPLQYLFLSGVESAKILFWESPPKVYYAVTLDFFENIYNSPWLRFPLRFAMAFICIWAMGSSAIRVWKKRKRIFDTHQISDDHSTALLTLLAIAAFGLFHSFFLILPRYSLVVAPLFLALVAWQFDSRKTKKTITS